MSHQQGQFPEKETNEPPRVSPAPPLDRCPLAEDLASALEDYSTGTAAHNLQPVYEALRAFRKVYPRPTQ